MLRFFPMYFPPSSSGFLTTSLFRIAKVADWNFSQDLTKKISIRDNWAFIFTVVKETLTWFLSSVDKQQKGEFAIEGYDVRMNSTLRKDGKKDCCFEICAPDKRIYQVGIFMLFKINLIRCSDCIYGDINILLKQFPDILTTKIVFYTLNIHIRRKYIWKFLISSSDLSLKRSNESVIYQLHHM